MTSAVAVADPVADPVTDPAAGSAADCAAASMGPIIPFVEVLVKMFTNSATLYARVQRPVC
jgi:hypothetical protein